MSSITTGPFRAPGIIVGTGVSPARLIINFKNPTNSTKRVRVMVDECPIPVVPVIPVGARCAASNQVVEAQICNEVVELDGESCRQLFVTVLVNRIYRVTVQGDIDEEAEKLEVSVVGTDAALNFHEPSMFFRHEDFVEVDDD